MPDREIVIYRDRLWIALVTVLLACGAYKLGFWSGEEAGYNACYDEFSEERVWTAQLEKSYTAQRAHYSD
jgi:hypothetical protein